MEKLALKRRPKSEASVKLLPAGDCMPLWSNIPLESKLPLMKTPKGKVVMFYTTKVGVAKNISKQACDFDLRDPNGYFVDTEYESLHDPHLRSHFKTPNMRRHLIKKGLISPDGKILCSLKEFNRYRQFLRHSFLFEIEKNRKDELEERLQKHKQQRDEIEISRDLPPRSLVRKRFEHQRECDLSKLRSYILEKKERLDKRLRDISEELSARENRQEGEEKDRLGATLLAEQQRRENLSRQFRVESIERRHLMTEREKQRRQNEEIKVKWNARKLAQETMLLRDEEILRQAELERRRNVRKRIAKVKKQRRRMEKKLEEARQTTRERRQRQEDNYTKNLHEKKAAIEQQKKAKRKGKRRRGGKQLTSTWTLKNVLEKFEVPENCKDEQESFMSLLNTAVDGVADGNIHTDFQIGVAVHGTAREGVQGMVEKHDEMYPKYLQMLEGDATQSKSVRFHEGVQETIEHPTAYGVTYLPVSEHELTPCASRALLNRKGSFTEALLLRLLEDLTTGRLSREDIMTLAAYSSDAIQSAAAIAGKVINYPELSNGDFAVSSSSVVAAKMVDFTLSKILSDIQAGKISQDDIISLTLSMIDNVSGTVSSGTLHTSDLEDFVGDTLDAITPTTLDCREDTPVCDALLDEFVIKTLNNLLHDLETERFSREQIQSLADSVCTQTSALPVKKNITESLENVLVELKNCNLDPVTVGSIVFAIVQTYDHLRYPEMLQSECETTEMIKDMIISLEEAVRSGKFSDLDFNIVKQAKQNLTNAILNKPQIERIATSIFKAAKMRDDLIVKDRHQALISSLKGIKSLIEENKSDPDIVKNMNVVCETVIEEISHQNIPIIKGVFLDILKQLKATIHKQEAETEVLCIVNTLESELEENVLNYSQVLMLASAVINVFTTSGKTLSVQESLEEILQNLKSGTVEAMSIQEIQNVLLSCTRLARRQCANSPELIDALTLLFRSVLNKLTNHLQEGKVSVDDLSELSQALTEEIDRVNEKHIDKETERLDPSSILQYLRNLVCIFESGKVSGVKAREIGKVLVEIGAKLLIEENTQVATDEDVEKHIRNLQEEIEREELSNQTLKQVTKDVISSTSNTAIQAVSSMIRGLGRDLSEGQTLQNISSVPEVFHSSSTVEQADFVLEVVLCLQEELLNGNVSKSSIAHFIHAVKESEQNEEHFEDNVIENLATIAKDIEQKRHLSPYAQRILKTYLITNRHSGALSDSAKAVEAILVDVSVEILTRFVRATLLTILTDLKEDSNPFTDRPTSVYVLRAATNIVVKTLVNHVLQRVLRDVGTKEHTTTKVNTSVLLETARCVMADMQPLSFSTEIECISEHSQDIEDIVLETLHNVVSNMILEHSMSTEREMRFDEELKELVLNYIQNIVEDQQDKRTEDAFLEQSFHDKKDPVIEYFKFTLQAVLLEMKQDVVSGMSNTANVLDASSDNLQLIIINNMVTALFSPRFAGESLSVHQQEEVKHILIESLRHTIDIVRGKQLKPTDLRFLHETCQRFLKEEAQTEDIYECDADKVTKDLEKVYDRIKNENFKEALLRDLSLQLATLEMSCPQNNVSSPQTESPSSSVIYGLVTDVLMKVTQQLILEPHNQENNNNVKEDKTERKKRLSKKKTEPGLDAMNNPSESKKKESPSLKSLNESKFNRSFKAESRMRNHELIKEANDLQGQGESKPIISEASAKPLSKRSPVHNRKSNGETTRVDLKFKGFAKSSNTAAKVKTFSANRRTKCTSKIDNRQCKTPQSYEKQLETNSPRRRTPKVRNSDFKDSPPLTVKNTKEEKLKQKTDSVKNQSNKTSVTKSPRLLKP